ncbi:MAG TPA: PilZ domain-containing protein [Fimbriimonadaceae bacterium]|nr:PilZ domain-containing protein [Fimbriimonadaceae bacterium]
MELPLAVGAEVRLISLGGSTPVVIKGNVLSLEPLQLETTFAAAAHVRENEDVLVVRQTPDQVWRIASEFKRAYFEDERWICELEPTRSWMIDRRGAPRFSVDVPIEIGFVTDEEGEPIYRVAQGTVENMSVTGARVRVDTDIPPGALLHVTFQMQYELEVKALAVTEFRLQEGTSVGICFVEFLEDGQYHLHEFLGKQAA